VAIQPVLSATAKPVGMAAAWTHKILGELIMLWFWYCTHKRWAANRHAVIGMPPALHKALMRMFYPL
jgi:hypothetical protein